MSILSEYEEIRAELGEEIFRHIERYLLFHPEIMYSDVIYNQAEYEKFLDWTSNTPAYIKENVPIYAVIETQEASNQYNFVGTLDEIQTILRLTKEEIDNLFYFQDFSKGYSKPVSNSNPTFSPNKHLVYNIRILQSDKDFEHFFSLTYNNEMNKVAGITTDPIFDYNRFGEGSIAMLDSIRKYSHNTELNILISSIIKMYKDREVKKGKHNLAAKLEQYTEAAKKQGEKKETSILEQYR